MRTHKQETSHANDHVRHRLVGGLCIQRCDLMLDFFKGQSLVSVLCLRSQRTRTMSQKTRTAYREFLGDVGRS